MGIASNGLTACLGLYWGPRVWAPGQIVSYCDRVEGSGQEAPV